MINNQTLDEDDIKKESHIERYKGQCEAHEDGEQLRPHVHCWILVLPGQRDVNKPFFIEPSTGEVVGIDNDLYLSIESLWNDQNYWCNMQQDVPIKDMSFVLMDLGNWEHIIIQDSELDIEDDEAIESGDLDEEILDLPKSWVRPLRIDKQQLENRYPGRFKQVQFRDMLCEYWAQFEHEELITKRFTLLSDDSQTPKHVHCFFERRKDRLMRRSIFYMKKSTTDDNDVTVQEVRERVHEWFAPGRHYDGEIEALKEIINDPGHFREFKFFSDARLDGLDTRTELYKDEDPSKCYKVIETFRNRADRLCYRSVRYNVDQFRSQDVGTQVGSKTDKHAGTSRHVLPIIKMTEKYERNIEHNANEDVSRLTFYVNEKRIRLEYHYDEGKVVKASREYVNGFCYLDPFGKRLTDVESFEEFKLLCQKEKECEKSIRDSASGISTILDRRAQEERDVRSVTTIYDTMRNRPTEEELREMEERERLLKEQREKKDIIRNYLPPDGEQMTVEIAERIYHAVLEDLKERLLVRGRIIQDRLQNERSALAYKKTMYNKNIAQSGEVSEKADEEYMMQCEEYVAENCCW